LIDLDLSAGGPFQGGIGQNISLGAAYISGKKYRHSISESICINTPIIIQIPPGYATLKGVAGFADDSLNKSGVRLQIETTGGTVVDSSSVWLKVDFVDLSSPASVAFQEDLRGATAIRLSSTKYACSTEIVWGDALVE
jgi:hypothetical protein